MRGLRVGRRCARALPRVCNALVGHVRSCASRDLNARASVENAAVHASAVPASFVDYIRPCGALLLSLGALIDRRSSDRSLAPLCRVRKADPSASCSALFPTGLGCNIFVARITNLQHLASCGLTTALLTAALGAKVCAAVILCP